MITDEGTLNLACALLSTTYLDLKNAIRIINTYDRKRYERLQKCDTNKKQLNRKDKMFYNKVNRAYNDKAYCIYFYYSYLCELIVGYKIDVKVILNRTEKELKNEHKHTHHIRQHF